jgi:hypothetical protein
MDHQKINDILKTLCDEGLIEKTTEYYNHCPEEHYTTWSPVGLEFKVRLKNFLDILSRFPDLWSKKTSLSYTNLVWHNRNNRGVFEYLQIAIANRAGGSWNFGCVKCGIEIDDYNCLRAEKITFKTGHVGYICIKCVEKRSRDAALCYCLQKKGVCRDIRRLIIGLVYG